MRIALHSVLREGLESGYDVAHARLPDDLVASFARFGIYDWSIWRHGRELFHLVEADDFGAALAALDSDPANERWQSVIGGFVDHFDPADAHGVPLGMAEVYSLRAQTGTA